MVRPVCVAPHPVLQQPARPIPEVTEAIRQLARDLIDTMYAHEGIGLAAPQVGQSLQLFVVNPSQAPGREVVLLNPALEAATGRVAVLEGCLSVPEVWERVGRAARVCMTGQDLAGQPVRIETDGLLAIVLQHELDHLEGRLFLDRLPWFRRLGSRRRAAACA
jgi:peptide deformylase